MTGHSAGGQVAHRYAAASRAEENFGAVSFRYVVANPSTYLYLRAEREVDSTFVVPDEERDPYAWQRIPTRAWDIMRAALKPRDGSAPGPVLVQVEGVGISEVLAHLASVNRQRSWGV